MNEWIRLHETTVTNKRINHNIIIQYNTIQCYEQLPPSFLQRPE